MKKQNHVSTQSATLMPVRVEDWTLFSADGAHWIRDTDLAERVEHARPRDVRKVVEKAIADGLIYEAVGGAGGDRATNCALVLKDKTIVRNGDRGGTQPATVYYLNEEAALLLVTRLRTTKAIELTKAIVRVFLAVARGEPGARAADLANYEATHEMVRSLAADVRALSNMVGKMSPNVGVIKDDDVKWITSTVKAIAVQRVTLDMGDNVRAERTRVDQRARAAVQWCGTGMRWPLLPADRLGPVKAFLNSTLEDLQGLARRKSKPVQRPDGPQQDLFNNRPN